MEVGDEIVKMQINSGVSCNVLPRKLPRKNCHSQNRPEVNCLLQDEFDRTWVGKDHLAKSRKRKREGKKRTRKILSGIYSCPRKLQSSSWFLSDTANETNNCPTAEHFASKRRCGWGKLSRPYHGENRWVLSWCRRKCDPGSYAAPRVSRSQRKIEGGTWLLRESQCDTVRRETNRLGVQPSCNGETQRQIKGVHWTLGPEPSP